MKQIQFESYRRAHCRVQLLRSFCRYGEQRFIVFYTVQSVIVYGRSTAYRITRLARLSVCLSVRLSRTSVEKNEIFVNGPQEQE